VDKEDVEIAHNTRISDRVTNDEGLVGEESPSLGNVRFISKEYLQQYIKRKKTAIPNKHYDVFDIILYKLDLDPNDIQLFVNGPYIDIGKIKPVNMEEDLIIPDTLFIFHSLHTIFIFFIEHVIFIRQNLSVVSPENQRTHMLVPRSDVRTITPPKSIIKSETTSKIKHTKKVRIIAPVDSININTHKKTRKNIFISRNSSVVSP
jgi:hypothetical protein